MESAFQFKNPILTKLSLVVNDGFEKNSDKISINLGISTKAKRKTTSNEALVELTLNIGDANSNSPFVIRATESAEFRWDNSLEPNVVEDLLKLNAPALLLSYLRPIIAQITSSTKYGTYNIPYINFIKMNEKHD